MRRSLVLFLLACLAIPLCRGAAPDSSANLKLSPEVVATLGHIYSGKLDLAIGEARQLEQRQPDFPLAYLLEAEAMWWKIWCTSAEFKYGMNMPRHREKLRGDQPYLDIAAKAYSLAEASLKQHETAEMHLYAGMADGLSARLYGLRSEGRAAAKAGVRAREHFTKALALDPEMGDACFGLGLYDYYVDTLSTMARVLRFMMGIPGGTKENGIRLLQRAIHEGQLTPPLARFYLGINLENYEQQYEEALQVISPLVEKYPGNPLFELVKGDLNAKLGRKQAAAAAYRAAYSKRLTDGECQKHVDALVRESLDSLGEPLTPPPGSDPAVTSGGSGQI